MGDQENESQISQKLRQHSKLVMRKISLREI